MRILIWGKSFPRMGGVERFVANLARALVARGDDVLVLADGQDTSAHDEPYPIVFLPMSETLMSRDPMQILPLSQKVRKTIADFNPDVIHFQSGGNDHFLILQLQRSLPVPFVVTLHGSIGDLERAATSTALLTAAASTTAVSAHIADNCIGGFSPRTILNAIPDPGPSRPPPQTGAILALGRLAEEKGFTTLLSAMPMVLDAVPDARLTLAGRGPDKASLADQIANLGLESAVDLRDWFHPDAVHEAMSSADMVVMPSHWHEPFGLVALEAAWAARPCIASDMGGLPEIVANGTTGTLVPAADPEALAKAITAMLSDPQRARTMGEAARERAAACFPFDAMVDDYRACLAKAAQQSG